MSTGEDTPPESTPPEPTPPESTPPEPTPPEPGPEPGPADSVPVPGSPAASTAPGTQASTAPTGGYGAAIGATAGGGGSLASHAFTGPVVFGAVLGGILIGTILLLSFIFQLVVKSVADAAIGEQTLGYLDGGVLTSFLANLSLNGRIQGSFDVPLMGYVQGGVSLPLASIALVGLVVTIALGRRLAPKWPVTSTPQFLAMVGAMWGASYLVLAILTAATTGSAEGLGTIRGDYGRPLLTLLLLALLTGVLVLARGFARSPIGVLDSLQRTRPVWGPALMLALVAFAIPFVLMVVVALVRGALTESFGATLGAVVVLFANLFFAALPMVFGAPFSGPEIPQVSLWSTGNVVMTIVVVLVALVTLVAGALVRLRLRGHSTASAPMVADIGFITAFGLLGMFLLRVTLSAADMFATGFGLSGWALLTSAAAGAAIVFLHAKGFPALYSSVAGIRPFLDRQISLPVPGWARGFAHHGQDAPATPAPAHPGGGAIATAPLAAAAGTDPSGATPAASQPDEVGQGGEGSHPVEASQPGPYGVAPVRQPVLTPEQQAAQKRQNRKLLVGVGAVAAVIIIAVVALRVVNAVMFNPQATAEQYWGALEAGKASQAQSMEVGTAPSVAMNDEVYGASPIHPKLTAIAEDKESATESGEEGARHFTVNYDLDGTTYSTTTILERSGKKYGLFDEWRVRTAPVGTLVINESMDVTLNGATTVASDEYPVYPGTYTVSADAGSEFVEISSSDVLITENAYEGPELRLAPTDKGAELVRSEVVALMERCNTVTEGSDSECGFGEYAYGDYYTFSWSMPTDPGALVLQEDMYGYGSGGNWQYKTENPVTASWSMTPTADAPDYAEAESGEETLYLTAWLQMPGEGATDPVVEVSFSPYE